MTEDKEQQWSKDDSYWCIHVGECVCMHRRYTLTHWYTTHTDTCTHTYTYTHIHAHMHTLTHTYMHTHTLTHTYMHTRIHLHTYMHIHITHIHAHILSHTYKDIYNIHTYNTSMHSLSMLKDSWNWMMKFSNLVDSCLNVISIACTFGWHREAHVYLERNRLYLHTPVRLHVQLSWFHALLRTAIVSFVSCGWHAGILLTNTTYIHTAVHTHSCTPPHMYTPTLCKCMQRALPLFC